MVENKEKTKEELIEQFKKLKGNISVACKVIGISRRTYYNWKEEDEKFRKKAEEELVEQKFEMDDYAEGMLYKHIKEGNIASLIFYLKTRQPSYRLKLKLEGQIDISRKLNYEEKELLKKALEHGGLSKDKE